MEPTTRKTTKRPSKSRPATSERRATLSTADTRASRAVEQALAREGLSMIASASSAVKAAGTGTPSTNLVAELNNIDFQKMIGGPLQACVDAQVTSSLATVNFIQTVGFKDVTDPATGTTTRELVMVDFSHKRQDGTDPTTAKNIEIRVPLLAMLPIPSLRIEHVIIDFNVKLNSVESSSVSSDLSVNASGSGRIGPINLKVSVAYQRKTATNVEVKKEYALNVNVKAVQDEIPAGLEKILNMLAA